jgi:hypothetical protein
MIFNIINQNYNPNPNLDQSLTEGREEIKWDLTIFHPENGICTTGNGIRTNNIATGTYSKATPE